MYLDGFLINGIAMVNGQSLPKKGVFVFHFPFLVLMNVSFLSLPSSDEPGKLGDGAFLPIQVNCCCKGEAK